MVIAKNVYSLSDQLILPAGFRLTERTIIKLAYYSIPFVYIEKDTEIETSARQADPLFFDQPHSVYVKESPEFQKFSAQFTEDIANLKKVLNDVVVKNAPLEVDILLQDTMALLDSARGSIHVFDMLHNLRHYDDLTYTHSLNVALICNVLAAWLHLNPEEISLATQCGLLHDIGKLKIPEEIIKKPDRLTEEEYRIIKTHPMEGYQILQNCNVNSHVRNAALMHHERCDRKGYPFGLPASKIDKYAKIVAIADVYDAMTSARIYRGSLCPFKVIEIFEREGLQKYDTKFILTFLENVVRTYLFHRVRLNDGREGDIIFINKQALSRPLLKSPNTYIDLSKEPASIFIEALL